MAFLGMTGDSIAMGEQPTGTRVFWGVVPTILILICFAVSWNVFMTQAATVVRRDVTSVERRMVVLSLRMASLVPVLAFCGCRRCVLVLGVPRAIGARVSASLDRRVSY